MGVIFERGGLFEDLRYAVERNGCASASPLGCPFPRSKFCGGVKLGGGALSPFQHGETWRILVKPSAIYFRHFVRHFGKTFSQGIVRNC